MIKLKSLPLAIAISSTFAIFSASASASVDDELAAFLGNDDSISVDFADYASKYGIEIPQEDIKPESIDSSITETLVGATKESEVRITHPVPVQKTFIDHNNVDETLIRASSPIDKLFMRNIPRDSLLSFTDKFMLLPNEKLAYFQDGKRIYSEPKLDGKLPITFCMLNFIESGDGRRASSETKLFISKVEEHKSLYKASPNNKGELINVTKLTIDHPQLKQLVCMGVGSKNPLSLGDLKAITGGLLTVNTQDYIDL
ncbi:hypothetical protein OTK49_00440 [Vibrio coralliirubri]|uniref:hypothetical protein n=1 Tax=Vibrio coralliirubri TaxID=1516159 RepID=UPI002284945B|nr:hypothetical protein [Vibrio coralliirubri]MCY9861009.1 hypothetical protein [Vibrio coralliirubri]